MILKKKIDNVSLYLLRVEGLLKGEKQIEEVMKTTIKKLGKEVIKNNNKPTINNHRKWHPFIFYDYIKVIKNAG